jgi:hypothetical protein
MAETYFCLESSFNLSSAADIISRISLLFKLQGLQRGLLGPQVALLRRDNTEVCERAVSVGQTGISQRTRSLSAPDQSQSLLDFDDTLAEAHSALALIGDSKHSFSAFTRMIKPGPWNSSKAQAVKRGSMRRWFPIFTGVFERIGEGVSVIDKLNSMLNPTSLDVEE